MTLLKTIFCANEQVETNHILSAAQNGDIVATCQSCERFLKFPAGLTKEEFDSKVEAHKLSNVGQVTQESIDATLRELADDETEEEQPE